MCFAEYSAAVRSLACVIGVTWAMSGCSGSPVTPGGPFPPIPSGPAPAVTEVVPSTGSTAGGATVKLVGTGFTPGMTATFGGTKVSARSDSRSPTTFYIESPAHAAGTVDLVVTNPDGQSQRLTSGYTYAPPDSFDLNGTWGGFSLNGEDTWIEFEVRGNKLVSASCQYEVTSSFTFTDFPTVASGQFSFTADGGAAFSGRIVSELEVLGSISSPLCRPGPMQWRASRKS